CHLTPWRCAGTPSLFPSGLLIRLRWSAAHRALHSFPTRRSSDLKDNFGQLSMPNRNEVLQDMCHCRFFFLSTLNFSAHAEDGYVQESLHLLRLNLLASDNTSQHAP